MITNAFLFFLCCVNCFGVVVWHLAWQCVAMTNRRHRAAVATADEDAHSTVSGLKDSRTEHPTAEQLKTYDLPSTYKIKYCRLCDNSSLSVCDFVEVGSAWGLLIPWGNGTRTAPSGVYCRNGFTHAHIHTGIF